jgi:hypothetical protein
MVVAWVRIQLVCPRNDNGIGGAAGSPVTSRTRSSGLLAVG